MCWKKWAGSLRFQVLSVYRAYWWIKPNWTQEAYTDYKVSVTRRLLPVIQQRMVELLLRPLVPKGKWRKCRPTSRVKMWLVGSAWTKCMKRQTQETMSLESFQTAVTLSVYNASWPGGKQKTSGRTWLSRFQFNFVRFRGPLLKTWNTTTDSQHLPKKFHKYLTVSVNTPLKISLDITV